MRPSEPRRPYQGYPTFGLRALLNAYGRTQFTRDLFARHILEMEGEIEFRDMDLERVADESGGYLVVCIGGEQ